jgi:UDP-glucose:(heptosyl)LPS alpha-1,3-glucosyltransferase
MRIGLVIDKFDPGKGGAERALALFARHAETAGHEVVVLAMSASADAPGRFVRVATPPAPRGPRDVAFAKRAIAAAKRERCDITIGVRHVVGVDVYWPHGGVHAETLAAVERSKGRALGAVSRALHRVSPKQRALLALERRFFETNEAARIWCVSDLVRRETVARRPHVALRIEVHPNGVDLDAFHPRDRDERRARVRRELRIAADEPTLLFFGGAWRMKGFPVLLDALATLKSERWTCVAAGARDDEARRAVARAGLSKRVRVLPHHDPRDLYAAADLFVQPTWRDPCSLATLEALACGVPVVTTYANGAAEVLDGFPGAGAVVPAGDADALAAAIRARLSVSREPNAEARRAAERRPQRAWLDALLASVTSRR